MVFTVYGQEGDSIIITRIDLGHGDEYLVEARYGGGYITVYSSFSFEKALSYLKQAANPEF